MYSRRKFLTTTALATAGLGLAACRDAAQAGAAGTTPPAVTAATSATDAVLGALNTRAIPSTGERVPVINIDFTDVDRELRLEMIPKGSGSENGSFLQMLIPADGVAAVDVECTPLDQQGVHRGVEPFVIDDIVHVTVGVVVGPACRNAAKDAIAAAVLGCGFRGALHGAAFCQPRFRRRPLDCCIAAKKG